MPHAILRSQYSLRASRRTLDDVNPSPALDALLLLSRSNAAANASLDRALSRVGLWLNDLSLLTYVQDAGAAGLSRAALAELLRQSQSETLRRVKPMEKLGWLERTADGSFALTLDGKARVVEATGLAASKSESWLGDFLSEDEIATLSKLLARLA
jgi:DNA-binding MarR family transcriptional regulator